MQIIKKDQTLEGFNEQKIINAVQKSARRMMIELSPSEYSQICNNVWAQIEELDDELIDISELHNIVEAALEDFNPVIAKSYRDYRNYKTDFVHMLDEVYNKAQSIMYIGDKENSNTDSALVSTKRSLIFNQLNKELYQKFFLTTEELKAARDGYIYIHDMSARRDTMNCCLFDVKHVLENGFEMGNLWYNEPKTLDVAFDVIGDIVLSAASQQYGGFTVPEVDKLLKPYAEKTYNTQLEKYLRLGFFEEFAKEEAWKETVNEMKQGYQGWEYKFNSVSSSRGDYPFIAITFGLGVDKFEKLASKTFLQVHREGQGKKNNKIPVLFPKLVFLYTENLHGNGRINEDLFEEGILTSAKTMYPDWLSLDGDTTLSKMYHKYGKVVSPMGKCKLAHVKPIEPC
jgi:ribonucleoside-triphosphate reductase